MKINVLLCVVAAIATNTTRGGYVLLEDETQANRVFKVVSAADKMSASALKKFVEPDLELVINTLRKAWGQNDSSLAGHVLTRDQTMITLLKLGDETALNELDYWIGESSDASMGRASLWIQSCGQPAVVPIVGEYLFVNEPANPFGYKTGGPYWITACYLIRTVLLDSSEIDIEVKNWISASEDPAVCGDDEYREVFRTWYRENRELFISKRYGAVKPGGALPKPIDLVASPGNGDNVAPAVVQNHAISAPQTPAPNAQRVSNRSEYAWVASALCAIAAAAVLLRFLRRG